MTKIGMQRVALAAGAFLTLTITALTITVAAQSRDTQIAVVNEDATTDPQAQRADRLKSRLEEQDKGHFSFRTTSPWKANETNIRGTLEFPQDATDRLPLVLVVHSADGIGTAEKDWVSVWLDKGYATFLLDYMTPRNAGGKGPDIPHARQDIADALKVLTTHPRIDTGRVAVQGLSNGAAMTVGSGGLIRSRGSRIGIVPKAYIMLYGGCDYNLKADSTSGAAYLFMVGDKDTLVPATLCTAQEALTTKFGKDVRTIVFPGAYHGFDGNTVREFQDSRFGPVIVRPNRTARNRARVEAGALLQRVFSDS